MYGDYSVHLAPALRLSLGGRFDQLHDSFNPVLPAGGTTTSTTHSAFSPKGGLNFKYLNQGGQTGNAYISVSRSFKAPTLDQLYDKRRVPVNFPPFKSRKNISPESPQLIKNLIQ